MVSKDLVRVEKVEKVAKDGRQFVNYVVSVGAHKILWVTDWGNKIVVKSVKPLSVPEKGFAVIRIFERF